MSYAEPVLPDLSGLSRDELALLALDTRASKADPIPAETLAARRILYREDVERPREERRLRSVEAAMAEAEIPPPLWAGVAEPWAQPEDRGHAAPSPIGETEYVEDLIRPGRIVVWAAEEGSGKSFAVTGELAIRLAVAGGSFADTWPVLATGPVLVLSEMHSDDDYAREETILASLGLERSALAGRYYRLATMTAAGDHPPLRVDGWRAWVTTWLKEQGALALIVDTATAATNVEPWGPEIQAVYRHLRQMVDAYPELAIILVVHLKKPQGRGDRRISDVLGEWGRWNDITVLQENDGSSLTKTKITVRKRVRHERRIVATKLNGLLVEPQDIEAVGPKVAMETVLAAIAAQPGVSLSDLGRAIGVSRNTAANYVATAVTAGQVMTRPGPRRATLVYSTGHLSDAFSEGVDGSLTGGQQSTRHPSPTYIGDGSTDRSSGKAAE